MYINRIRYYVLAGVVMMLAGSPTLVCAGDPVDEIERAMLFVDKAAEGTELFGEGKFEDALVVFVDLTDNYADLDEDGYAAISVGDCLAALKRYDQARHAYDAALAAHPELAERVKRRLINLAVAGEITDEIIEQLRLAARADDASRYGASWQLGRALQKQARQSLGEAVAAFKAAAASGSTLLNRNHAKNHVALLKELTDDLVRLIEPLDHMWDLAHGKHPSGDGQVRRPKIVTEEQRYQRVIRIDDSRRMEFQITRGEKGHETRFTVNGEQIDLTAAQKAIILRHQQRINDILLEAAEAK